MWIEVTPQRNVEIGDLKTSNRLSFPPVLATTLSRTSLSIPSSLCLKRLSAQTVPIAAVVALTAGVVDAASAARWRVADPSAVFGRGIATTSHEARLRSCSVVLPMATLRAQVARRAVGLGGGPTRTKGTGSATG